MFQSSTVTGGKLRKSSSTKTRTSTSTKTSTKAYTQGNVTVTGSAGNGTTSVSIYKMPPSQPKRAGGEILTQSDGRYDNKRLTSSQLSSTQGGSYQHDSKQRQWYPLQMVLRSQQLHPLVPYVPISYACHSVEALERGAENIKEDYFQDRR